jgi:hypothetical protein
MVLKQSSGTSIKADTCRHTVELLDAGRADKTSNMERSACVSGKIHQLELVLFSSIIVLFSQYGSDRCLL